MKVKLFAILVLLLLPCFLGAQNWDQHREILLLEKKSPAGKTIAYTYLAKGRRVICRLQNEADSGKIMKIRGKITRIDSSFMVVNNTRVHFDKIVSLSTWTRSRTGLHIAGGPLLLGGCTTFLVCAVLFVSAATIVPAFLGGVAGVVFLCIKGHKYDFIYWSCSKATYTDYLEKKMELFGQMQQDRFNNMRSGPHGFPMGFPGMK